MTAKTAFLPATQQAVAALGADVAAARRELRWTQQQLAERLGVSRRLVSEIENGSTSASVGVVLEAAIVCGIDLFGVDKHDLRAFAADRKTHAALLPTRVRRRRVEIPNDF